ncbi:hypothetical protein GGI1_09923, partial [Acidithiobacillus sp. GGI-221]
MAGEEGLGQQVGLRLTAHGAIQHLGDLLQETLALFFAETGRGAIRSQAGLKKDFIRPDTADARREGIIQQDVAQGAAATAQGLAQYTKPFPMHHQWIRAELGEEVHIAVFVQHAQAVTQLGPLKTQALLAVDLYLQCRSRLFPAFPMNRAAFEFAAQLTTQLQGED